MSKSIQRFFLIFLTLCFASCAKSEKIVKDSSVKIDLSAENKIVKTPFILTGSFVSNKKISAIQVSLQNSLTGIFFQFETLIDEKSSENESPWNVEIPELEDGEYTIFAVGKGKNLYTHQAESVKIEIDNTVPDFELTKQENISYKLDSLEFHAKASDKNELGECTVNIKNLTDNKTLSFPIDAEKLVNDETIVFARYYSKSTIANESNKILKKRFSELRENFIKIYGEDADADNPALKEFSCSFTITDKVQNSKVYEPSEYSKITLSPQILKEIPAKEITTEFSEYNSVADFSNSSDEIIENIPNSKEQIIQPEPQISEPLNISTEENTTEERPAEEIQNVLSENNPVTESYNLNEKITESVPTSEEQIVQPEILISETQNISDEEKTTEEITTELSEYNSVTDTFDSNEQETETVPNSEEQIVQPEILVSEIQNISDEQKTTEETITVVSPNNMVTDSYDSKKETTEPQSDKIEKKHSFWLGFLGIVILVLVIIGISFFILEKWVGGFDDGLAQGCALFFGISFLIYLIFIIVAIGIIILLFYTAHYLSVNGILTGFIGYPLVVLIIVAAIFIINKLGNK